MNGEPQFEKPSSIVDSRARAASSISAGVIVFSFALVFRAVIGIWKAARDGANALGLPDEQQYWLIAKNLVAGLGLRDELGFLATRMPLYPAFLSLFITASNGILMAKAVQWVVGAAAAVLTMQLGTKLANRAVGLFAGLFVAFDPFLAYFSCLLLTESFFTCAFVAFFFFAAICHDRFNRSDAPRHWNATYFLIVAVLGGACVYIRESSLGLVLFTLVYLALGDMVLPQQGRGNGHVRKPGAFRKAAPSLIFSSALIVSSLIPWTARNKAVVGEWIWLTTRGGISLYDGVGPQADGSSNLGDVKQMPAVRGMSEVQWNRYFMQESWRSMRENPRRILHLALIKLQRTWNPLPNAEAYRSLKLRMIAFAWSTSTFTLAAVGGILWVKKERGVGAWMVLYLLLPAIYLSALHSIFVGSVRYRLGAVPMIAVLAGYAVHSMIERFRTSGTKERGAGAV